jgi:histidinol-phosphate aminotransferase
MQLEKIVRKNIAQLKPYSTARDEFKGQADVFLDANENPFANGFNRYPDPLQLAVKEKLSSIKNIPTNNIFLGNGSDEAIDLLIRIFCEPNLDSILITEPTYGMYRVCADINAVHVQSVLLTTDFDLDLSGVLNETNASTKIIFLCSPNNPSGNLLSLHSIETILNRFQGIVVVDEAYIDFTDQPSLINRLAAFPNLIVLQTLSKAWGLAGLRLGMCFASPEIIGLMNKVKYPYNISIETQRSVADKLGQYDVFKENVATIVSERKRLALSLSALDILKKVYPSDANFILAKLADARAVHEYLLNRKIIVRDRSSVIRCDNCLRISVGTPEENTRLINELQRYSA